MATESLRDDARTWLAVDPDPETRAELEAVLAAGDEAGLAERFGSVLEFGTAGLRGPLGAGPNRMNRVLVRRAAAGLGRHLLDSVPGAEAAGVVIGFDARHKSDLFALDTAGVLAGLGIRARLLPGPLPTPVLAFAVRHLGCAAGVMVTASHNPPADNGYKVYWGDGAQIVPPVDAAISAALQTTPDPTLAGDFERMGPEVAAAYVSAASATVAGGPRDLSVVYTPLHGVGRDLLLALFERGGFAPPVVVPEQADPHPDFPTVRFPNPEEPGALDLALALAAECHADVVLANDPDADRLAVAVDGRMLTGDQLGWLLADHLLQRPVPPGDRRRPLVATTVVSSSLLARLAADRGAAFAETLTGFKWITRAGFEHPDHRFVLGYEEALGYCVGELVRDKDGLTAALVVADLAARAKAAGRTLFDLLDDLALRYGRHVTAQVAVRFDGAGARAAMARAMAALRAAPPATVAGRRVEEVEDLLPGIHLPPSDVLVLRLVDGGRLVLRPSGTEPKLKAYLEVVVPAGEEGRAGAELAALQAAVPALVGL